MNIEYRDDAEGIAAADLGAFFDGWPTAPSPERRLAALAGADVVVTAWDADRMVGFITALSDGALSAFVSLLEVVADQRGRGIGTELVRRAVERLRTSYGIDVVCDEELRSFYERLGFVALRGMAIRRADVLP